MTSHRRTARARQGRLLGRKGVAAACVVGTVVAGGQSVAFAAVAHPHRPKPALGRFVSTTHVGRRSAAQVNAPSEVVPAPKPIPAGIYSATLQPGAATGLRTRSVGLSYGTPATVSSPWQPLGSTGIAAATSTPASSPVTSVHARATSAGAASVRSVPVRKIGVTVLTPAAASRVVSSGIGLTLRRTDGQISAGTVALRVPDSLLTGRFGGDFVSRVRWLQVPLDSKGRPVTAQARPVAYTRDASRGGATVMTAQVSNQATMLVAASTPTSSTGAGTWAATPLKLSSTWQVSTQSGDFTWNYPLRLPPAPAGPSPAVTFGYDSQSVDGETGASNNQADELGDGWSLGGSGFIERSYVSCSQDDGPTGPVKTSGDLCWSTNNATVSFGGHSGRLIKDSSGTWKIQADDGTRVDYLTGAANGCGNSTADDGCWRLTTTDGTQYYFGRNKLPNWVSPDSQTNSAWTVPVFGNDPGEPGYNGDGTHAGTFATEATTQAWRWNLDYVVDPHGNSEAFYYDPEYNHYEQNGTTYASYVRGGVLDHIDYGMRAGSEYAANAASAKVLFTQATNGRCFTSCSSVGASAAQIANPTKPATTTYYYDTPWDQYCTTSPCTGLTSPTFWSAQMLASVKTEVLSSGAYTPVDVYSLTHSFPSVPTGAGESPALWLASIGHTGDDGSQTPISTPNVTFGMLQMQNRVYTANGLSPLERYRVGSINLDSGAQIVITYSPQQCTAATDGSATSAAVIEANPQTNTYRCFPEWWTPQVSPPLPPSKDLFHKYVVTQVDVNPITGGDTDATQETDYNYAGTPAWRFNTAPGVPDDYRTWSDYAGYNSVEVRVGSSATPSLQQTTDYTYLQGMDGDPCGPATSPTSEHRYAGGCATSGSPLQVSVGGASITDSLWWAGQAVQTVTRNGVGGPVLSTTVSTPWASGATASASYSYTQTDTSTPANTYTGSFTLSAHLTGVADSTTTSPLSTGGNRTLETKTSYDPTYGLPTQVESDSSDAGTTCTKTTYALNTTAWLINYPSEATTVAVPCASTPSYPGDVVSDTRYYYDGGALGAAPSKGDVTEQQTVKDYTGSTPNWITTSTQYDALGRTTQTTDPMGRVTKTAYTPSTGGPLTQVIVTNPAGWTSTTQLRPNWGVPSQVTDVNGEITTATYDALGRVVKVWLPNRPQASNTVPSIGYAYTLSTTAANAVATTSLNSVGGTISSYQLYDGLDRPIQTQSWTDGRNATSGAHQAIGTIITTTGYDSGGRVNYTTQPYGTASVNPSATLASRPRARRSRAKCSPASTAPAAPPWSASTSTAPRRGTPPTATAAPTAPTSSHPPAAPRPLRSSTHAAGRPASCNTRAPASAARPSPPATATTPATT